MIKMIKGINLVFLLTLSLLRFHEAEAIVIRHDVDDAQYQALGDRYTSAVAYAGGCAATVISEYWLLTAAHCISGRESHFFSALHAGYDYRIEKLILHPKFKKSDDEKFDIALIQMKDPIKNITSVDLYRKYNEKGKEVIFVGRGAFGNGRDGLIRSDFVQRGATNTVLSVSDQIIEFRFDEPKKATSLEGISSRGDSGGPAFIESGEKLYVVGVSSYQDPNGFSEGTYGVHEFYSRVSLYINWLDRVVNQTPNVKMPQHPLLDSIQGNQLDEFISYLIKDKSVLRNDKVINEVVYQSVLLNRIEFIRELIKSGLRVEKISINNMSFFEFSLVKKRLDYFDMIVYQLKNHNEVHDQSSYILPLTISMFNKDKKLLERVRILVKQGANVNAKSPDGDTALISAGWNTEKFELVKYLIDNGSNVNAVNNDGNTALMDAAALGKKENICYLLTSGADALVKNKRGKTASDLAKENNHYDILSVLAGEAASLLESACYNKAIHPASG